MTTLAIDWGKLQESKRANRAQEAETHRSNVARETETNRSNLANEQETHRSNVARETETNRSNLAKEAETHRSNVVREEETHRSNVVNEKETHRANTVKEIETNRSALAKEAEENRKNTITALNQSKLEANLKVGQFGIGGQTTAAAAYALGTDNYANSKAQTKVKLESSKDQRPRKSSKPNDSKVMSNAEKTKAWRSKGLR